MKNIIFDWSGVIKDAVEAHHWVVNKLFVEFGLPEITRKQLLEEWEQPHMVFYNRFIPELTYEKQTKIYRKYILDSNCPPSKPIAGIVELIKQLKNGNRLAVISSDLPETINKEIEEYGLAGVFDDVVAHVHHKQDALKRLIFGDVFESENTYFIGDTNHEIEEGKKAGIKTIGVTWGLSTEERLRLLNPDFIAHSVEELEEILG